MNGKISSFLIAGFLTMLAVTIALTAGGHFAVLASPTTEMTLIEPVIYFTMLLTGIACMSPALRSWARTYNDHISLKYSGVLTGWVLGIVLADLIGLHFGHIARGLALAICVAVFTLVLPVCCHFTLRLMDYLKGLLFKKPWHATLRWVLGGSFTFLSLLGFFDLAVKYGFIG